MPSGLVLVIAQAFKETFSVAEVADRVGAGVRAAGGEVALVYGSDGGDGLLDALRSGLAGREIHAVADPLGRPVPVEAGWLDGRTAVVESRLVCGLALLAPRERNPLRTSTRGVGELIAHMASLGAERVLVGLGGSATMDGGVGMARAWGWMPRDSRGVPLPEGGGALRRLARLDPGERPGVQLVGLCDVQNPLAGPSGARVYAPQKGASAEQEEELAAGLERLATVCGRWCGGNLAAKPGAGAGGGLGFGILWFGSGELRSGAAWVLDRAGFDSLLDQATLVVTGEGSFDRTSSEGKLTGEVLRRAKGAGVPALILAPQAEGVPEGVLVETGGGIWSGDELERRARDATARAFRLLVG